MREVALRTKPREKSSHVTPKETHDSSRQSFIFEYVRIEGPLLQSVRRAVDKVNKVHINNGAWLRIKNKGVLSLYYKINMYRAMLHTA
ncbi:hypothetical protein CC86DRAFT_209459 [Ophiobolus disseminans]|uniref:Uncharacterized protein n=1 Tax=Ophiobolus disseminans TaxID=1469910 RepID=A0A6A7A1X1_9PLEO|nr:hypothetical protein CC86DRAFT_209459 [Ophiobolus disseminans]